MRVFVTGASGFIGTAVVPELLAAGHEVVGLARSDAAAATIRAAGADVQRGDLDDLDGLRAGADGADGVIHLAFIHDFAQFDHSIDVDRRAIAAFGDALAGSGRPFLIASGVLGHGRTVPLTERDTDLTGHGRLEAAAMTLALAERGVRSGVVRLPPTVHGDGDKGFVPTLINVARERGVSGYVGDGTSRWPAVHRLDAARLYRLALEQAPAGSVIHAIADEGVPTRVIAEVIGRHLDLPVASVAPGDVDAHFGWIGMLFALDSPASSALTQAHYSWQPKEPGLLEDLEAGHYFS